MADALTEFLQEPDATTFGRMRAIVLADPNYNFYSTEVDELSELAEANDFAALTAALPNLMPSWLLSPRLHLMVCQAAERAGDADTARIEMYVARACLRGLLLSGDGSKERPYQITHISDEYDLLEQLGKEVETQTRVSNQEGVFDRVVCSDRTELWFNASPGVKSTF